MSSIDCRSCDIMKEKTPLSHKETSKSQSEVSKSNSWKITSFSKTMLLKRELFLTMLYTINSSLLLVTKYVSTAFNSACRCWTQMSSTKVRWHLPSYYSSIGAIKYLFNRSTHQTRSNVRTIHCKLLNSSLYLMWMQRKSSSQMSDFWEE